MEGRRRSAWLDDRSRRDEVSTGMVWTRICPQGLADGVVDIETPRFEPMASIGSIAADFRASPEFVVGTDILGINRECDEEQRAVLTRYKGKLMV
jgi:hypothetical protein